MTRWIRFAALPTPLVLSGAQAPPDRSVSYELAPEMAHGAIAALDVTIRLRADPLGTTTLDWADGWAGEHTLRQWARDIRIEGGTASKRPRSMPAAWGPLVDGFCMIVVAPEITPSRLLGAR